MRSPRMVSCNWQTEQRIQSDLAIPPGEYLLEVLEEVGMPQAELARRMGRPTQAVNEVALASEYPYNELSKQGFVPLLKRLSLTGIEMSILGTGAAPASRSALRV